MDKNKKLDGILEKTAQQLTSLVDVNTVIGKPVKSASGYEMIPLTKVTMGYLCGGGEYGDVQAIKEGDLYPFAGGAGTVISMKPIGFLIDDGSLHLVKITDDPMEGLLEKAGEFLNKLTKKEDDE